MRAALHVVDPLTLELRLKLRRAAPRGVLPTLVGQDLPRRTAIGDPARERLEHERASLVMGHRQAHEVARLIVEECRDVDALVLAQEEREEVRLPELIGLGALEAVHFGLRLRLRRCSRTLTGLGAQHPPHRRLGSPDPQEPLHHVADPPAPRLRVCGLGCHDRRATRRRVRGLLHGRPLRRFQRRRTTRPISLDPVERSRVRHAQSRGRLARAHVPVNHRSRQFHPHIQRPGLSYRPCVLVPVMRSLRLVLRSHLSAPLLPSRQATRMTSARYLRHYPSAHKVVRGTTV